MSVEIIGLVVAIGTWLVTMVGGFLTFGAWLLKRMDERFERADIRSDRRFAVVDARFSEMNGRFSKIDGRFSEIDGRFSEVEGRFSEVNGRFSELDERLHRIEHEQLKSSEKFDAFDVRFDRIEENIGVLVKDVNDVKIAIARLEGPQPRLIVPGA